MKTEMTGSEASALSYLAEFPNAPDAIKVIERLNDEHLKAIGRGLIDETTIQSPEVKETVEALKKWAKDKWEAEKI